MWIISSAVWRACMLLFAVSWFARLFPRRLTRNVCILSDLEDIQCSTFLQQLSFPCISSYHQHFDVYNMVRTNKKKKSEFFVSHLTIQQLLSGHFVKVALWNTNWLQTHSDGTLHWLSSSSCTLNFSWQVCPKVAVAQKKKTQLKLM